MLGLAQMHAMRKRGSRCLRIILALIDDTPLLHGVLTASRTSYVLATVRDNVSSDTSTTKFFFSNFNTFFTLHREASSMFELGAGGRTHGRLVYGINSFAPSCAWVCSPI